MYAAYLSWSLRVYRSFVSLRRSIISLSITARRVAVAWCRRHPD